jgi:hypothetical protein
MLRAQLARHGAPINSGSPLMLASTQPGRSLLLGAVLLLAACEHAEGGVCQSTRDCEDGLVCDLTLDENRGVCRDPGDIDAGSGDAGAQLDGAVPVLPPDGSADAAVDEPPPVDGGGGAAGTGSDAGDSGVVDHEDAGSDGDGG